jgi:hypothetical protein
MSNSISERAETTRIDPQRFYDRSRASGFELLKTLVSLSTAIVAAFFFALTRDIAPRLLRDEFYALACALGFMVLAVFAGIIGWGVDAKYYDYWADSLNGNRTEESRTASKRKRDLANTIRRYSIIFLAVFFTLGIFASAIYLYLRMSRSL